MTFALIATPPLSQCLVEIGDAVRRILRANGQAQHGIRDAARLRSSAMPEQKTSAASASWSSGIFQTKTGNPRVARDYVRSLSEDKRHDQQCDDVDDLD
jgi:hypothetical protein